MRTSSKYRKGIWNGRGKSSPNFNRKTGTYYGRGIIDGKKKRIYSKARQLTHSTFKKRYNPTKFKKWLSKYK